VLGVNTSHASLVMAISQVISALLVILASKAIAASMVTYVLMASSSK